MSPRIYLAQAFATGDVLTLPAMQSRHLQVLRLQPGHALLLFNGHDSNEWQAEVTRIGRAEVEVRVGAGRRVERELPVAVTLAFGIPANERMDALVEKATELGAVAIQPLVCERSVVRLAGERAETRGRHWSAVAASASEQCGRVRVPGIGAPMKLDAWLRGVGRDTTRLVLSFAATAASLTTLAITAPKGLARPFVVLSGPEGGLGPDEESAAVAAGFIPVSLGPRVLRADTAPLVALAWLGMAAEAERR
ncbi:MAG: 16S rRNA (uracil(1498)-N(3))-methyltransferase [Pseudomonadota bacterium]|nr:16S rRNA (uracil(1498)-N(3))-methyltransferase [Pseudomonadota bacterium]